MKKILDNLNEISFFQRMKALYSQVESQIKEINYKVRHLEATNIELVRYHFFEGNWGDLIFRIKILKLFHVFPAEFSFFLAFAYFCRGDHRESRRHLAIYSEDSQGLYQAEAAYLRSLLAQGQHQLALDSSDLSLPFIAVPEQLSQALLKAHHNKNTFYWQDKHKGDVGERFLAIINNFMQKAEENQQYRCLEIGCGYGNIGAIIGQAAQISHLEALDNLGLSKYNKGEKAINLENYNSVEVITPETFINTAESNQKYKFDIFVIHEALFHYCDLVAIFKAVEHLASKRPLFLCACDSKGVNNKSKIPLYFDKNFQKFYYRPEYVLKIAEESGWQVFEQEASIKIANSTEKTTIFAFTKDSEL